MPRWSPRMRQLLLLDAALGGGAVVAPTYTMPQSAALVGHWRAEDITPQTDSTALATSWTDRVNGYQFVNPAGKELVYRTNRQGTFPALQGNGSSQYAYIVRANCAAVAAAIAGTPTIMVVARNLSTGSGASNASVLFGAGTAGSDIQWIGASATRAGSYPLAAQAGVPFTDTGFNTFAASKASSQPAVGGFFINGGLVNTYGSIASSSSNNIGLFARVQAGTTGDLFGKGEILAVLVWNVRLTPAEVMQADNYLRQAYGVASPRAGLSRYTVFDGDSITAGQGAAGAPVLGGEYQAPYIAAAALGLSYGQWSVVAIPGTSTNQMSTRAALMVDAFTDAQASGLPLRLWAMEWYNQAGGAGRAVGVGATAATAMSTYIAARRTANASNHIIVGTSTNSGSDNTNSNVERTSYNNLIVANYATYGADAVASVHLNANIGANSTSTNVTYFQTDQTHLTGSAATPDGYEQLAAEMVTAMTGL